MPEIPPIRRQVNVCATLLGEAISHTHGKDMLELVESLRKQTSQTRGVAEREVYEMLSGLLEQIDSLPPSHTLLVGKAFSIYFALINACENGYRTSRLKNAYDREAPPLSGCLVYVLTAHPTEVRSESGVLLIHRLTGILAKWFSRGGETPPFPDEERELAALIRLMWKVGIHKASAVTPDDEINHIAQQFSDSILSEILSLRRRGADLRFRTWVGGDKDGHPGINAVTLHASFRRTRRRFHQFFRDRLQAVKPDLELLGDDVSRDLKKVERALQDVRHVTAGDGIRMNTLRHKVAGLVKKVETVLGKLPVTLLEMCELLALFPAMVLPVELREESTVFLELKRKKSIGAIGKMMRKAQQVAEGGRLRHYVQGLIVSMTRSVEDLEAAVDVVDRTIGTDAISIIPLFERGPDLDAAPGVVDTVLRNRLPILSNKTPEGPEKLHMEIMLGYSDTSKRMGAFASRRRIFHAMHQLTEVCAKHDIDAVFFHGSGGSVTRGGGSIKEQFGAWPETARKIIKLTLQGEMVERTMVTPTIFRRNVEQLLAIAQSFKTGSTPTTLVSGGILDELAALSREAFEKLVNDVDFKRFVAQATPYPDLSVLHLGSRPSHRPGKEQAAADLAALRAIPWVLCFTQGRFLVPSWYGIGTAFEQMRSDPAKLSALKKAFDANISLKGFIKLLGFSLAKGDRAVFSLFVDTLVDEPDLMAVKEKLLKEERRAVEMVSVLTGSDNILWFQPWLAQSILMRGSAIHPLSVIEVAALRNRRKKIQKEHNDELLRIAIAGTAIGMLTTG
ncbi:MAG: phosphoenolpyruvate carboxylase [bacterium]|nr:phosphoenolpyruvate carboxylase [bacterium]